MLKLSDVRAGYATASVLRGIDLTVDHGEVVVLLGRNGMGKSTLVRAICGMTPPTLTSGSITLDGREISGLASHAIANRGIGLVPQGRRVFGSLTVDENFEVVPKTDGMWTREAVYELFPSLRERRNHRSLNLSGGEQQMLSIGRALKTNPRLLVMDEPSEGLAPTVLDLIRERLRQLSESGQAVLIAEQNVDLALDIADTVAILGEEGRMAWHGPIERLRDDSSPIQEHLGV